MNDLIYKLEQELLDPNVRNSPEKLKKSYTSSQEAIKEMYKSLEDDFRELHLGIHNASNQSMDIEVFLKTTLGYDWKALRNLTEAYTSKLKKS